MIRHPAIDHIDQAQMVQVAYSGAVPHVGPHSTQLAAPGHDTHAPLLPYETFLSSLSFVMASIVALAELTRVVNWNRRRTAERRRDLH